jgi:hypothetical protein
MHQAHWCGAGEDDEEGGDDDAPHRLNPSHGAATDSHSLMIAAVAAAEVSVVASSSTATSVPHATVASPSHYTLSQPISPLPRSPSLAAGVPASPSKSVLGIQIDPSAAAAAASLSLVVRASLGAARPLQTLTPVSSVGAHLNLLGSPSAAALSALSAALVSASTSAAMIDSSSTSALASPTHRSGCVPLISIHAIAHNCKTKPCQFSLIF